MRLEREDLCANAAVLRLLCSSASLWFKLSLITLVSVENPVQSLKTVLEITIS